MGSTIELNRWRRPGERVEVILICSRDRDSQPMAFTKEIRSREQIKSERATSRWYSAFQRVSVSFDNASALGSIMETHLRLLTSDSSRRFVFRVNASSEILPPVSTATTDLPLIPTFRSRSAATATAPDGSTTNRQCSKRKRTDLLIASSETSTNSSTYLCLNP